MEHDWQAVMLRPGKVVTKSPPWARDHSMISNLQCPLAPTVSLSKPNMMIVNTMAGSTHEYTCFGHTALVFMMHLLGKVQ